MGISLSAIAHLLGSLGVIDEGHRDPTGPSLQHFGDGLPLERIWHLRIG
jgi:hypothetical protein